MLFRNVYNKSNSHSKILTSYWNYFKKNVRSRIMVRLQSMDIVITAFLKCFCCCKFNNQTYDTQNPCDDKYADNNFHFLHSNKSKKLINFKKVFFSFIFLCFFSYLFFFFYLLMFFFLFIFFIFFLLIIWCNN